MNISYTKKDEGVIDVLQEILKEYPNGAWLSINDIKQFSDTLAAVGHTTIYHTIEKIMDRGRRSNLDFFVLESKKIQKRNYKKINVYFVARREIVIPEVARQEVLA